MFYKNSTHLKTFFPIENYTSIGLIEFGPLLKIVSLISLTLSAYVYSYVLCNFEASYDVPSIIETEELPPSVVHNYLIPVSL